MTEEQAPADGDARLGTDPTGPRRGTLGDSVVLRDGATLLDYEILPAPNPLQAGAGATLTLVVSNGTHALVTCTAITLTLAVGTNAKDLVANAEGITSQAPTGWSVAQSGGTFTLTPQTPAAGQIGAAGLSFVFVGLAVNDQVGTTAVTIDEMASTPSQPPMERTGTIALPKFPAKFTLGRLTADPLEVSAGDSATLSWSGSELATYQLEFNPGSGPQSVPVGNAGPYAAKDLTRYPEVVFTLVVSYTVPGQDQPVVTQRQASVQVDAALPMVTSFAGSASGGGIALRWASRNADACSVNALPQLLKPSGSTGPLPLDRIHYTVVAESLRTGTRSAPSGVNLRLSVTRQRAIVDGTVRGLSLLACGASTLVAVVRTLLAPTSTYLCFVDRASLGVTGLRQYYWVGPALAVSADGSRFFTTTKRDDNTAWLTAVHLPSRAAVEVPAPFDVTAAAFSPDGATLYAITASPPALHVLDAALVEQRSVPLPDIGNCVVSGDGSLLYMALVETLLTIDTATGTIVGQAPIPSGYFGTLVVDPVRSRAFVLRSQMGPPVSVAVVDLEAHATIAQIPVEGDVADIAMGPSGDEVYVFSTQPSQFITVIDAEALVAGTTIGLPVPDFVTDLAVAPGLPPTLYALANPAQGAPSVCELQVAW
ncbi:MAG TPA: hypothetical protein VE871_12530 [Longimicrobium sp.]|nr:hypothetical protein [Longimicrobium sp.]